MCHYWVLEQKARASCKLFGSHKLDQLLNLAYCRAPFLLNMLDKSLKWKILIVPSIVAKSFLVVITIRLSPASLPSQGKKWGEGEGATFLIVLLVDYLVILKGLSLFSFISQYWNFFCLPCWWVFGCLHKPPLLTSESFLLVDCLDRDKPL